jgi:hypothetical protein
VKKLTEVMEFCQSTLAQPLTYLSDHTSHNNRLVFDVRFVPTLFTCKCVWFGFLFDLSRTLVKGVQKKILLFLLVLF